MPDNSPEHSYTEDSIRSLDWREHIRLRPGMYIGKLGDGSSPEDGIYLLLKEAIDNSIDEHVMGYGKKIIVKVTETRAEVRDFGRGVPLGKLMDCAAKINTGAKYDSEVFKRSVGLNGVGIKAANALSSQFVIQAFRAGRTRRLEFTRGEVTMEQKKDSATTEKDGTLISFVPDTESFGDDVRFQDDIIERMIRYYAYLNPGLTIQFNGRNFVSKNGLVDLLEEELTEDPLYPVIHIAGTDIEVALTHVESASTERIFSFVNGQNTTQGGTHLAAFREALVKEARDFFKKNFDPEDVRAGVVAAISVKVQEPVFESQTKTRLGSTHMEANGRPIRGFVSQFLTEHLDNYLHRHPDTAKAILERIQLAEAERKEMKDIQKLARDSARKAKIHNKKLRDCKVHLDSRHRDRHLSTLFITEGDSAGGSITKVRDPTLQAVFSLRGKPLNCFGLHRKVVYQNDEFNFLQHALNIEGGLDELRYNRVVVATDADVDGMHIRLLLMTFFLQFFPELVKRGHVFILRTPLFRVRNKKQTIYCYSEAERKRAVDKLGARPEITRFKGLGEISPDEFRKFIGPDIKLERVRLDHRKPIKEILTFYMGKNTPLRQQYIMENLRVEENLKDPDGSESAA